MRLALWIAAGFAVLAFGVLLAVRTFAPTDQISQPPSQPTSNGEAGGTAAIGGSYELINTQGETVTPEDFQGQRVVYYFGFTHCPDVCPMSLNKLSRALDLLGERADDVTPVFVSVDPERDTPERVGDYLAFDERLVGLTGSPEKLEAILPGYGVYAKRVDLPNSAMDYTMDHSSVFLLFDEEHQFLRPIPHGSTPEELADALVS